MMRPPITLWLCTQPTDMRCSYDGLAALVRRQLGQNPLSGHGFIFINRRRTQLKCLYFQAGGYCVWSKRLERGRFAALSVSSGQAITRSHAEFEALIEGRDLVVTKRRKRWHPKVSAA